jgi:tripartite-type tricarboxylate transporter receptor subunit TctC
MKTNRWLKLLAASAAMSFASPGFAADAASDYYPGRPIRLVVPNAPGSSVDTLSRIMANKLTEVLGQQVVIDNRAGAGGIIGMEIAKTATPDGYTLIAATTAASTIAMHLQKKRTFDPLTDYAYVLQFAETPNVLFVNPGVPVKSVKELIDFCKSKQGQVNMASAGSGSQSHLSGAFFLQAGSFPSLHVPYKGGGASVASVIAGESHWSLTPAPAVMSHVNSGKVRALGHSLPKRTNLLPNVPAIAETIPGFDYSGWQGFFMPKGTPAAVVEKLRSATIKAAESADVKKLFAVQATEIVIRQPGEFQKVVQESIVKNAKLVQAIGLKAN